MGNSSSTLSTHEYYSNIILYRISDTRFYLYIGEFVQFIDDFKIIKDKYYDNIEVNPEEFPKDLYDVKLMTYIPNTSKFIEYFQDQFPSSYDIVQANIDLRTEDSPGARIIEGHELEINDPSLDQIDLEEHLDMIELDWRNKFYPIVLTI